MKRARFRIVQASLALALLVTTVPLATAYANDDEASSRPLQLASAAAQGPDGAQAQPARPPAAQPTWVYGFFRDPLWPGPGQRFIAAECPIGVGQTIIHYCPSLPPADEANVPTIPPMPYEVLQCSPFYNLFPVCRRPMQPW
jgi:hypothetical protein